MQAQSAWETVLLGWAHNALESAVPSDRVEPDSDALTDAYQYCRAMTRIHSKTFYVASGLLPPDQKRAARALYAFCRVTDDMVDRAEGGQAERAARLQAWRERAMNAHPPCDDPVVLAWADARARFSIPSGYAEQLIDGVGHDLEQTRYATFEDLAAYSYGVASTVGLMAMHIVGFSSEAALPYAVKLGVALQMTNILRDVAEDWRRGRLYLPQDELAHYGLTEREIDRMVHTAETDDRWVRFMTFQVTRTRRLYDEATPGIGYLNPSGRFAISAAANLYRAILRDIEMHNYNVFTHRAHTSNLGKLCRLPGIWWRSQRARVA
ncbi:MAG TPA: phytoene/squalene synthase family protein [Candidatus Limnocylindrales bacterium]|nr:phytoene/squalene synthase family protein [Candidatus Limnocylindrales bacterium]